MLRSEPLFVSRRPEEGDDSLHALIRPTIERRRTATLWTQPYRIKPALVGTVYGDGRALFGLTTINSRPWYYVIRGDSAWRSGLDCGDGAGPDMHEIVDSISWDIEEEFGPAIQYGVHGQELARKAAWPALDYAGGCSWWREKWPKGLGIRTVPHPLSWEGDLLDVGEEMAASTWATDGGREPAHAT